MHLNHPETVPLLLSQSVKKLSSVKWPLVPKRLGTAALKLQLNVDLLGRPPRLPYLIYSKSHFHSGLPAPSLYLSLQHLSSIRQCASLFYPAYRLYPSVQFSSVAQLCPSLCDPVDCSTPGLPVHHQLPEFTQTHVHWVGDAIQPSHPSVDCKCHEGRDFCLVYCCIPST